MISNNKINNDNKHIYLAYIEMKSKRTYLLL